MKGLNKLRRKSRQSRDQDQEQDEAPRLASGLKVLVLVLQVAGAVLQLWRR